MPRFRLILVLALLVPGASLAETAVHMPPTGFRYTVKVDGGFTAKPGSNSGTNETVTRAEVTDFTPVP